MKKRQPQARSHLAQTVLRDFVDPTGRAGPAVRTAFGDVEAALSKHGYRLSRPVVARIAPMPIMGSTHSTEDGHELNISTSAIGSGMLDGLIAHEMGHMVLTERGHPSHDPSVHARFLSRAVIPRAGVAPVRQAVNHVQDIYADDIAFLTDLDDRAYAFFSDWVRNDLDMVSESRWRNVGLGVSNGFAVGNLERHAIVSRGDPIYGLLEVFDRRTSLRHGPWYRRFFRDLAVDPTTERAEADLLSLAERMADDAHSPSNSPNP